MIRPASTLTRFLLLILIVGGTAELSAVSPAAISGAEAADFSDVRGKIIRLIEDKKIPSLSLAVVRDGQIVWEEAFGLSDLDPKTVAGPETLYPIASVTKPLTAAALMILVERGLVDLDKPANAYLANAKLRAFEGDAARATVRRLLHHTSGLPMYWRFYYAGRSTPKPPLETILQRYGMLVDRPGENYNYSNLGYAVLESIIEQVSGKPYPEFVRDEVFKPLGMSRTAVFSALPQGLEIAEKYSATLAPVPFCDHDTRGASSIYSTARDVALFSLLHLKRLKPDQKAILKPESIAVIHGSRDPGVRTSSYGLGIETGTRFGFPILTHGGAMDGCRAHLAMIPSQGLAAAVLINGENVRSIEVCDWIFAALLPVYARNLRSSSPPGAGPPQPPAFRPPAEMVGIWEGTIHTHEANVQVRLAVEKSGEIKISRRDGAGALEEALAPLKTPAMNRGVCVVHFPQIFRLSDAPAAGHRTVLGLTIRKDRLSGEANLIASDGSYSLPSFIALKRAKDPAGLK